MSAAAGRYARAIFELGLETGQLAAMSEQVGWVAEVYAQSPELRAVLDNPLVEEDKRQAMLAEICGRLAVSELVSNAVRLLARRRRLRALPEIARRLGRLLDEHGGVIRATVTSATELPESFFERLTSELEGATGRKILLERRRDPALIAGVVTRIGDNTIDGSIRGQFAEIERRLLTLQ